jgi:head-tail adaptor
MVGGINVGELDTRIIIQRSSTERHEVSNDPVKTWTTLKTIWCKELGPKSKEGFEARQLVAQEETRFFARAHAVFQILTADLDTITADNTIITADNLSGVVKVVNETMRCIRKGEVFYIRGIEGSGRRGWVIINAEKRDNGQS